VRITRLKERRELPREPRKRGEPDAVLAGTTPPPLSFDETGAQKDEGRAAAGAAASTRRP
jgi:hypothetical protein